MDIKEQARKTLERNDEIEARLQSPEALTDMASRTPMSPLGTHSKNETLNFQFLS